MHKNVLFFGIATALRALSPNNHWPLAARSRTTRCFSQLLLQLYQSAFILSKKNKSNNSKCSALPHFCTYFSLPNSAVFAGGGAKIVFAHRRKVP